jgi:hypothetical protein
MKKGCEPCFSPLQTLKKFSLIIPLLGVFWMGQAPSVLAIELEPYPDYEFSRDSFTIDIFREERPSFYWVNAGVPDAFFNNVNQVSGPPPSVPTVYSIRSIEYGVKVKGWLTDQLQLGAAIPFEANALLDGSGNTQNAANFGDIEVSASYLLSGKREKGNFFGVDGWYRFSTGTNPFYQAFPLLATGKGAPSESIGLIVGQEAGRFSFFQSIHYEKTQPISLNSADVLFGPGVFQWPDNLEALGRVNFLAHHVAQRSVTLYYELRMRMSGLMEFDNQPVTYGYNLTTDRLFFSTFGMDVRVDKTFSAKAKVSYLFPTTLGSGWLFSLSLEFRPI